MAYSSGTGSGGQITSNNYNATGNIQFNYAQLEGIWIQAGGSPGAAPIAAAIAIAESGGNTTATNHDSNGSVDRGLWQINSVHGAQSTYDVMGNARAAVAISNNGTNWAPWTTYTSGAYRQYVQANVPPDMNVPINGTNAAANAVLTASYPGGSLDPLNYVDPYGIGPDAAGFFGKIFNLPSDAAGAIDRHIATALQGMILSILNPLINMVAGIAGITAGAVMVLFGIFMMVKNTETGQAVGRTAGTAAQAGVSALAPETAATTQYISRGGQVTNVTQQRRAAGQIRIGGRPVQYRPARVRTTVERPEPAPTTQETLRNQAGQYTNRKQPTQ